jgi:hypothetical protein
LIGAHHVTATIGSALLYVIQPVTDAVRRTGVGSWALAGMLKHSICPPPGILENESELKRLRKYTTY